MLIIGGIEEAYKAFAPQMGVVNDFEEAAQKANGRIFVVNSDNLNLEENTQYKAISDEKFETRFKGYTYQIKILEKFNKKYTEIYNAKFVIKRDRKLEKEMEKSKNGRN